MAGAAVADFPDECKTQPVLYNEFNPKKMNHRPPKRNAMGGYNVVIEYDDTEGIGSRVDYVVPQE